MPAAESMPSAQAVRVVTDPLLPQSYVVKRAERETPDTFSLVLHPQGHADGNAFLPGQFSMVSVYGVGELPISISGDPVQQKNLVYTVRSVGKATHALVSRKIGEEVGVRGPFGRGWPLDLAHGKDVVIIAGGIGLAPPRRPRVN